MGKNTQFLPLFTTRFHIVHNSKRQKYKKVANNFVKTIKNSTNEKIHLSGKKW